LKILLICYGNWKFELLESNQILFFIKRKLKIATIKENRLSSYNRRLEKIATSLPVAVVKIGITGDPGCGSGYEQITTTATACTPLIYDAMI
jgi:hypothetical protein